MTTSLPKFISFEGIEGCGKTTQINHLKKWLEEQGEKVIVTREPGGTELGEGIRYLLKHSPAGIDMSSEAEILLFASSRSEMVRKLLIPSLEKKTWIISDRYADSTTVYQGVARGLNLETVQAINDFATKKLFPTLTFLLDIPLEVSFKRIAKRGKYESLFDRIEEEGEAFFCRVKEGYYEVAKKNPKRVRLIEAEKSEELVMKEIRGMVQNVFFL